MSVYSFRYISTNGGIYSVTCRSYNIKHGVLCLEYPDGTVGVYDDYLRILGKVIKGEMK